MNEIPPGFGRIRGPLHAVDMQMLFVAPSWITFANFPRPVGGTHQRSACQLCGGSAGPAHSYERVFGGDIACAICIVSGNHMGIKRWGWP